MSNLKKELNNFILYLQNYKVSKEENLESFIKDRLNEFIEEKKCSSCSTYGFPCIICVTNYNMKSSEGYPLHIN
jgi:hypothetical protein